MKVRIISPWFHDSRFSTRGRATHYQYVCVFRQQFNCETIYKTCSAYQSLCWITICSLSVFSSSNAKPSTPPAAPGFTDSLDRCMPYVCLQYFNYGTIYTTFSMYQSTLYLLDDCMRALWLLLTVQQFKYGTIHTTCFNVPAHFLLVRRLQVCLLSVCLQQLNCQSIYTTNCINVHEFVGWLHLTWYYNISVRINRQILVSSSRLLQDSSTPRLMLQMLKHVCLEHQQSALSTSSWFLLLKLIECCL